jgi:hypothetical protein
VVRTIKGTCDAEPQGYWVSVLRPLTSIVGLKSTVLAVLVPQDRCSRQCFLAVRYTEIHQSHRFSQKTHQRLGWDAAKTDEPVCMCERGVWEGEYIATFIITEKARVRERR